MKFTVGDLTSMIKKNARMDLGVIGANPTEQNTYIQYYMTMSLWHYAAISGFLKTSDPLVVASNGYVTFKSGGVDISDLYAQNQILNDSGKQVSPRTSFDSPSNGWYRESYNSQIHIQGAGTYTLKYHALHEKITAAEQEIFFPQTSYDVLMYDTIGRIKQSKNDDAGAAAAFDIVKKGLPTLIKSVEDATKGLRIPSLNDMKYYG